MSVPCPDSVGEGGLGEEEVTGSLPILGQDTVKILLDREGKDLKKKRGGERPIGPGTGDVLRKG